MSDVVEVLEELYAVGAGQGLAVIGLVVDDTVDDLVGDAVLYLAEPRLHLAHQSELHQLVEAMAIV